MSGNLSKKFVSLDESMYNEDQVPNLNGMSYDAAKSKVNKYLDEGLINIGECDAKVDNLIKKNL